MSRAVMMADLPKALEGLDKELRAAVARGIRSGARRGRSLLVRKTPKDQGLMKASWQDSATRAGAATAGEVAEVFNTTPYAGIIEHGARPHPVSEEGQLAIYEWVRRHFAGGGSGLRKVTVAGVVLMLTEEQARVGAGVLHKLRTKGQKPTYFIRDSQGQLQKFVLAEVVRELAAASAKGGR